MLPSLGVMTPVMSFKSVDLPAPFRPMIPRVSPFFTVKET